MCKLQIHFRQIIRQFSNMLFLELLTNFYTLEGADGPMKSRVK